jgi:hypothetical protein
MTALILQVLMIPVGINVARKGRNKTTWTLTQLHWRMWLSIVGAVVGLLLPVLEPEQPGSPNAILYRANSSQRARIRENPISQD